MATKGPSGDDTHAFDRRDAQLAKPRDSGDTMTMETCVTQLNILSDRVCNLQDRCISLQDQLAAQRDEKNAKSDEDFVLVKPQQPESGCLISRDMKKLTKYIQNQLESRTLIAGTETYRYSRTPEGELRPQRCEKLSDLPSSSPTACQDVSFEEILQQNSSLREEIKTLRSDKTQLSSQLSQCQEELRQALLADAMQEPNAETAKDKATNSVLSSSPIADESSDNLVSPQTDNQSLHVGETSDSLRSVKEDVSLPKGSPNAMEESSITALKDQVSHLRIELSESRQREWKLLSEVELHKLQAETYQQDFEREKSDKEELKIINKELRRGWNR